MTKKVSDFVVADASPEQVWTSIGKSTFTLPIHC